MAGIYIHIPFCKTKCHYCDFYKQIGSTHISSFLQALHGEIVQRASELHGQFVDTIYIGGGTPSLLAVEQLNELLGWLHECFVVRSHAEITLECNPDDLTPDYIRRLGESVINRLSIGAQSFQDCDLQLMNRRHCAMQAIGAVRMAQDAGFDNISIDLIYGLPQMPLAVWQHNIAQAVELNVSHVSAYHLTYHEGTLFYKRMQEGLLQEIPDEESFQQFEMLREKMAEAGYEHYEISNFAKEGRYSQHNRAYWERKPYVGLGPSAHSFDWHSRRWNCSSVSQYVEAMRNQSVYFETEQLSEQDQYNDYIITRLRTKWGIDESYLQAHFSPLLLAHFLSQADAHLKTGQMLCEEHCYTLSTTGLFVSDAIMEDLCFFA